ncbi:hypothetical protein OFM52_31855, partial [Escherichia coli]|nr:hypothetical protein [Escherichia coli]
VVKLAVTREAHPTSHPSSCKCTLAPAKATPDVTEKIIRLQNSQAHPTTADRDQAQVQNNFIHHPSQTG